MMTAFSQILDLIIFPDRDRDFTGLTHLAPSMQPNSPTELLVEPLWQTDWSSRLTADQ